MHIAIIPPFLAHQYEKRRFASGSFFWQQASALQEHNQWHVSILYPKAYGVVKMGRLLPWKREHKVLKKDGVELWYGYTPYLIKYPFYPCYVRNTLARLFKAYIQRHGIPDVLWIQSSNANHPITRAAIAIAETYQRPFFAVEHTSIASLHKDSYALNAIGKKSLFLATVSSLMSHTLKTMTKDDNAHFLILPNCLSRAYAIDKKPSTKFKRFTFHNTSYLRTGKNPHMIIKAFARFQQDIPESQLIFVGDGPQRAHMETLIDHYQLRDHCFILGFIENAHILRRYVERAHVFVTATSYETFHIALIEALACGLPCISTPHGIATEMLDTSCGLLIEQGTENALYDAMRALHKNYARYDAQTIRQKALKHYAPSVFAQRITTLLEGHGIKTHP